MIQSDGTIGRVRRSEVLGLASDFTKREAHRLLEEKLRPINHGYYKPQSTITFTQFVKEQYETTALPTLRQSTQGIYRAILRKHLLPRFGNHRLCDIHKSEVQRFILAKLHEGQSWESANKIRVLLSKVLSTAVEYGYLNENPAQGIKMPERTQKRPPKPLTREEARRLLVALEEPSRTIALVGLYTGLRISEILGLRWKRVDLFGGSIRVEEASYRGILGQPKTKASRREVPLPFTVVQALTEHRSRSQGTSPDGLVFATANGTPLSDNNLRNRQLHPACHRAGIWRIGWHTLRHTHQSLLHALGMPLKVSQAQLGHSKLSTTLEIYTHVYSEAQREAVTKLERVLDPIGPKLGHITQ